MPVLERSAHRYVSDSRVRTGRPAYSKHAGFAARITKAYKPIGDLGPILGIEHSSAAAAAPAAGAGNVNNNHNGGGRSGGKGVAAVSAMGPAAAATAATIGAIADPATPSGSIHTGSAGGIAAVKGTAAAKNMMLRATGKMRNTGGKNRATQLPGGDPPRGKSHARTHTHKKPSTCDDAIHAHAICTLD